jgi:hypothetical protein
MSDDGERIGPIRPIGPIFIHSGFICTLTEGDDGLRLFS